MGIGISVEGLTKSFGSQRIWEDVTMEIPEGEVSVLLGPSGTGKSVFLKSLIGLLRPERGSIIVDGTDITECSAKELYDIRTLFGVMFQDGALFGSMNLYDNTAFPLREHTKKKESEIRDVVMEKLEMVGLGGDEKKFPGEISGGMRKRAGLARKRVGGPERAGRITLADDGGDQQRDRTLRAGHDNPPAGVQPESRRRLFGDRDFHGPARVGRAGQLAGHRLDVGRELVTVGDF